MEVFQQRRGGAIKLSTIQPDSPAIIDYHRQEEIGSFEIPTMSVPTEEEPRHHQPDAHQRVVQASSKVASQTISLLFEEGKKQGQLLVKQALTMTLLYMKKYPQVRIFVLTASALSILPVGIFSLFVGISFIISVCTAILGVFLVQSGLVLFGISILVPVVIFINNSYVRKLVFCLSLDLRQHFLNCSVPLFLNQKC